MQLLVSVRSALEVGAALSGGADIIDAKEPSRGSLGPVSPEVMGEIVARVPGGIMVSIALGDVTSPGEIASSLASLQFPESARPVYLKVGCAGVNSVERLERLIATAVEASRRERPSSRIVAVAYADAARTGSVKPDGVRQVSAGAGADGILLDTGIKDGLSLFRWIEPAALADWTAGAREAGLLAAIAGGLTLPDISLAASAQPDVVGVRSAACDGGRLGCVSEMRVQALRRQLDSASGSLQGTRDPLCASGSRNA
jgi:(5-formylfuran-3-yl)methyl phosphate synthase